MLIATFIEYEKGGFHSYVAETSESEFNDRKSRVLTDAIAELLERYGARRVRRKVNRQRALSGKSVVMRAPRAIPALGEVF